jgi:hypothetical protein
VKFFDINLIIAANDSTSSLKLLVVFSGGFDTLEFDSASGVSPIETKQYSSTVTGVIQTYTIDTEIVEIEFNVDAE